MTPGIADRVLAGLPDLSGRWRRPVLVALMGPPGTGKSEIAGYLTSRFPLANLSTDAIRLRHGLPSGPATHDVIRERLARREAAPEAAAAEGKFVITPAKLAQLASWFEPLDAGEPATLVETTDGAFREQLRPLEARLESLALP